RPDHPRRARAERVRDGLPDQDPPHPGAGRLHLRRPAGHRRRARDAGRADDAGGAPVSDSGERNQKATDRHLREARQKGKLSRSQDLTAWLGIGAAAITMPAAMAAGAAAGTEQLISLPAVMRDPSPDAALGVLGLGLGSVLPTLGTLLTSVVVVTLLGAVVQGGVRMRRFTARYEQFNLINGVKRIFGLQSLWEGAKALLKTAAIAVALWAVISTLIPVLSASGAHSVTRLLGTAAEGTAALLQVAILV